MNRLFSNKKISKSRQDIKGYCFGCTSTCAIYCGQFCAVACSNNCHAAASLA
jgi:ribosomally synthesized peptide (Cys-rich family)